jgi:hypothetical protein
MGLFTTYEEMGYVNYLMSPSRKLADALLELFAVDKLEKVAFRKDSFGKVVLNERHKEIVKAMVGNHVSRGSQFQDLVTGKGQGLVVLLHGKFSVLIFNH